MLDQLTVFQSRILANWNNIVEWSLTRYKILVARTTKKGYFMQHNMDDFQLLQLHLVVHATSQSFFLSRQLG